MTQVSPDARPAERPHRPDRADRALRTDRLLVEAARAPDPTTREHCLDEVVELNMGVAEAVAARYRQRGIDAEDLNQVAYLALTRAVRQYDVSAGHPFLAYAVPCIRGELRRYFRDAGWVVRPPRRIQELQGRVMSAQSELAFALGRAATPSEIADLLRETRADVEEALATDGCFTPTSLDQSVGDGTASLAELLAGSDDGRGPAEARLVLGPVVRTLSERDRRILMLRFFEDRTQREIGDDLGVNQTQVSRLLTQIFAELRTALEAPAAPAGCPTGRDAG